MYEAELIVEIYNVLFQGFEIITFLFVSGHGVARWQVLEKGEMEIRNGQIGRFKADTMSEGSFSLRLLSGFRVG